MIPARAAIPDVLAEILKKAPLTPEKVSFAWRVAVGPAVARVSTVRLGDNGILHVTVTEEHWGPAIKRSSSLILTRLSSLLGPDVVTRLDTRASKK
jgi:hypothetical protein